MTNRRVISIVIALFICFGLVLPALAGGWATFTLDELPRDIIAGEPVTIHYTIRQHGNKPLSISESNLVAVHPETGETVSVQAQPGKLPGEYLATLTFPLAGTWEWYVDGFGKQTLPTLTVHSALASRNTAEAVSPTFTANSLILLSLLGWLIAAFGLVYAALRRKRWALGLFIAGTLVALAGMSAGNIRTSAQSADPPDGAKSTTEVAYGRDLFVAKGCITCHNNRNIERKYRDNSVNLAVDLTSYPTSLEYLRVWLKDPSSIKPKTEMPDLGLDEKEIEALAAFLLAGAGK